MTPETFIWDWKIIHFPELPKKRFHTFNDNPDWLRENCRNNVKCNDSVLREEHLKNSFWPDALGKGEIIGFKLKELACRSLQISFN